MKAAFQAGLPWRIFKHTVSIISFSERNPTFPLALVHPGAHQVQFAKENCQFILGSPSQRNKQFNCIFHFNLRHCSHHASILTLIGILQCAPWYSRQNARKINHRRRIPGGKRCKKYHHRSTEGTLKRCNKWTCTPSGLLLYGDVLCRKAMEGNNGLQVLIMSKPVKQIGIKKTCNEFWVPYIL